MSAFFCKKIAFLSKKVTITEKISFADSVFGTRPPDCSKLTKNPKHDNDVTIFRHDFKVKIFWRRIVYLVSLVTGSNFMSVSSLVLELWQLSFVRDWPEIRKSEIPSPEICPISEDWGELWIPNLAWMSLIKCYWMLQNSSVTPFTVFELLRENQLGGVKLPPTSPSQIRV